MFVEWNTDLVGEEAHGLDDTRDNTFDNEGVNIGLIVKPDYAGLVWFDVISGIL